MWQIHSYAFYRKSFIFIGHSRINGCSLSNAALNFVNNIKISFIQNFHSRHNLILNSFTILYVYLF